MLEKYFDEEELKEVYEGYEESVLANLDEKNIQNIINYLEKNTTITKDILLYYLDLFTIDVNEFIRKFEKLKQLLGENYEILLENKMDYLERMYTLWNPIL